MKFIFKIAPYRGICVADSQQKQKRYKQTPYNVIPPSLNVRFKLFTGLKREKERKKKKHHPK